MDEEIITEEETPEEQGEDTIEEPETTPEPEPVPDYAGMIGEVRAELENLRNQIEELRNGFAIMVENGATIQDDSQLPGPLPEPQPEDFTYTPLQDLDYPI